MTKRDPAAARVRHLGWGDPRIIPVEIETTFLVPLAPARDDPLPCVADLPASAVVLLDAGDLLCIQDLLAGLGIDHQRVEACRVGDLDWPRPRQLLVASGSLALGLSLHDRQENGFATLAVSNEDSRGYARRMRELGFQYVINQPIHPGALRLLLQQILVAGPRGPRARLQPGPSPERWRRGPRRQRATLVELSPLEGVLHVEQPAARSAPVELRILGGQAQPPLALRGHAVGCEPRSNTTRRYALAVAWDITTEAEQQTLQALLTSPGRRVAECSAVPPTPRPRRALRLRVAPLQPPRRPSHPPLPDRRQALRGELRQEIVALDTQNRVCTTLVGRDLSNRAIRVEPGAGLHAGQPLRIAIHTARGEEPLVVESLVERDDAGGSVLGFQQIRPADAERLRRIVEALPPLGDARPGPRGAP